jgi:hypothetical protein
MGSARLAVVGLFFATLALGCAGTESIDESDSAAEGDAALTGNTDHAFGGHFASPTIVRDGAKYHAWFAKQTIGGTSYHVPHASFTEDGQWKFHGEALPHLGRHAKKDGVVWAPAAAKISKNRWMLYYTAELEGTASKKCIWRAHSSDAHGPFVDDYDGPIVCLDGSFWAIDPYLVKDNGDHWHLAARIDEPGHINTIQIRRLDDKAEDFEHHASWHLLTENSPQSWEQPVLENAGIVELTPKGEKHGHWFVFYSGGAWENNSYAIGYADCGDSINGHDHGAGKPRCTKVTTKGGWMQTDSKQDLYGPGTPTFYTDQDGHSMMSVQAWQFTHGKKNPKNDHGQIMRTYRMKVDQAFEPQATLERVDL